MHQAGDRDVLSREGPVRIRKNRTFEAHRTAAPVSKFKNAPLAVAWRPRARVQRRTKSDTCREAGWFASWGSRDDRVGPARLRARGKTRTRRAGAPHRASPRGTCPPRGSSAATMRRVQGRRQKDRERQSHSEHGRVPHGPAGSALGSHEVVPYRRREPSGRLRGDACRRKPGVRAQTACAAHMRSRSSLVERLALWRDSSENAIGYRSSRSEKESV